MRDLVTIVLLALLAGGVAACALWLLGVPTGPGPALLALGAGVALSVRGET